MSSLSDSGEPNLLRLIKWGSFCPNITEFHQFLISPTRELLLFLSHQSEALLISLSKDRSSEVSQEQLTSKLVSPWKGDPCVVDSAEKFEHSTVSLGIEKNKFSYQERSLLKHPAVLCDVQSVAWSNCGDGYNRNGKSTFRDILFVSCGDGIYVHGFYKYGTTCENIKSLHKADLVHGRWVVWGPTFTDSRDFHGILDAKASQEDHEGVKITDSEGSSASKNWFKSFLIDADFCQAAGQLEFRFPEKSCLPSSAEVVSFNVLEGIVKHLENSSGNAELSGENTFGLADFELDLENSKSSSIPIISDAEDDSLKTPRKDDDVGSSRCVYQCSKVFSSICDHYVGLTITHASPHHIIEDHVARLKTIVIILSVSHWGFQWTCSVDLQESCPEINPLFEWVDFQIVKGLLFCLNCSGIIRIFDAKSGDAVLNVDVLENSFMHVKGNYNSDERTSSLKGESPLSKEGSTGECQRTKYFLVKRVLEDSDSDVTPKKFFRRLLFTSQSPSLAAIDENGVIYSVDIEGLLSEELHPENSDFLGAISPLQQSSLGMLASWKAASSEISHHKEFYDFIHAQSSKILTNSDMKFSNRINTSRVEPRKKRRLNVKSEEQMDYYPSGFSVHSLGSSSQIGHHVKTGAMRRVFLPFDNCKIDDAICFSPFGITRLVRTNQEETKIVHIGLQTQRSAYDDSLFSAWRSSFIKERNLESGAIGCCFEGFLYVVTDEGLYVVLPSVSISSHATVSMSLEHYQPKNTPAGQSKTLYVRDVYDNSFRPWQIEVLDRTLLYEGPEEADYICWRSGWDLKIARMRRMELGLYYLRYDEIERSLEKLADLISAEEGMLRLLLASSHKIFCKVGSESEIALASRLLTLAASFATKLIQRYGLIELEEYCPTFEHGLDTSDMKQNSSEKSVSCRLEEMAHYLEVIRNLQQRLFLKSRKPTVDGGEASNALEPSTVSDGASPPDIVSLAIVNSSESENQEENIVSSCDGAQNGTDKLSLSTAGYEVDEDIALQLARNDVQGRRLIPRENSRDMIARWELDSVDFKMIVEDALSSDRIPLAVLQLHRQRQREMVAEEKPYDSFGEVRGIGRAIAYDLFLKGESALAIATLKKLGEDMETSLRELLFGTLRRSIRSQVLEEMKFFGFLKLHELKKFEGLSLIERIYPSSSFWETYLERERQSLGISMISSSSEERQLLLHLHKWFEHSIKCDEIDGVVIGPWRSISKGSDFPMIDESVAGAGYWACAATWSDSWDQTTMDRIALDQPLALGVDIPWESRFQYHLAHNDWDHIKKLLDVIPLEILVDGVLSINLNCSHLDSSSTGGNNSRYLLGVYSSENLGPDLVIIPNVKILKLSTTNICSSLIKSLLEKELAKRFIFLKENWESAAEIMHVLSRAHLIHGSTVKSTFNKLDQNSSDLLLLEDDAYFHRDTWEALHRFVVHFCALYGLPNFLDLYLDHHDLVQDGGSLSMLKESAGRCQWARWLMLSRVKGQEYDASFANARSILPDQRVCHDNDIICTVDDIADGGELVALATLMYAPVPIQNCLLQGSINRFSNSSFQCTLEHLQPTLQKFPALRSALVSACIGHDSVSGGFYSSDYLKWREGIFSSAGGDTCLVQMLPYWFPKSIRRLVKIFAQAPLGIQTSSEAKPGGEALPLRESGYFIDTKNNSLFNGVSWEASIEKRIKEELYSSLEENKFSIEHHLHRGHALGVFNHLLALRARKNQGPGSNSQADVQTLLEPLTEEEGRIFSSVMPLAIKNFDNPGFVASCVFLLELLGLPCTMLHVDISALRRISSLPQEDSRAASLAKALADNYPQLSEQGKQPPGILVSVLHHLEKASLPSLDEGKTCGLWLRNGSGDGAAFRSRQKADSKRWSLVTEFCRRHDLPPSTKYLALLAKDNDWVGFLSEAQFGGFPADTVVHVASEFSDPRLRLHVSTVLRSMQSPRKRNDPPASSPATAGFSPTPVELFALVADCEKQKNPGEVLLKRAKDLRWSLLAMIASCFPDVSPLSCLIVWLEITAARETSSIKVDDISSQIVRNVTAAVESTNELLPASDESAEFHYDRRNPKRMRYSEPQSVDPSTFRPKIAATGANPAENQTKIPHEPGEALLSLSSMVAVLCEQQLYLPLLRAFDMFLPLCSLLPFVRFLQAFSQMRLSEATAHLASFSARMKEEPHHYSSAAGRDGSIGASWISRTAVKAAEAVLSTCPSAYEKLRLLRLLESADFGDGGASAACFRREYWKLSVAEPLQISGDDASLLTGLVRSGKWEEARHWAKLMESSDESAGRSSLHQVTEMQAEAMVAEYKEFLWDVPEERSALWANCQGLFLRHSLPPLQAGKFFLRHAQALEREITPREVHELLLLSMQWLSGTTTRSSPVYPSHLLREMEIRVWLQALEAESRAAGDEDHYVPTSLQNPPGCGTSASIMEQTAAVIAKMDDHMNSFQARSKERNALQPRLPPSSDAKRRGKVSTRAAEDGGFPGWDEELRPADLERAVLSLLEHGQVTAARQLQQKLSPASPPSELRIVDAALRLASGVSPGAEISLSDLDPALAALVENASDILQALEGLASKCGHGGGRGLCRRIAAVARASNVLGLPFSEAFEKKPAELLQLLSLKAQDSLEEARLLVQTHAVPPAGIARILAESFLKGLLAAHRGGYMDYQNDEGPAPLLWRFSDFLRWAELCPCEQEMGHALTRLVMTGQDIPHACEVELLILAHHFYKLSACLDGVDVLVALAAKRVESYVMEGDFSCLARLVTGVSNFHALNFILGILIENDQLELLLRKFAAADPAATEAATGFRMAVLTALKHFRPHDLDASAMVYGQFDMKHEMGALLEQRAREQEREGNEGLLEAMRLLIGGAEVYKSVDAGQKTHRACARASLLSLQVRMPDAVWTELSETNARRAMAEQPRFQEALVVAEAYGLNQPGEWAPALWARMLRPDLVEPFVAEMVGVLPLPPVMLLELARFYRAEVVARGDQSHFSAWLSPGRLPAEWGRLLGRSLRCLLRRTRDLRLRAQLAALATGFNDVVDACNRVLDKVPDPSRPLILRKGHGGAYLPLT